MLNVPEEDSKRYFDQHEANFNGQIGVTHRPTDGKQRKKKVCSHHVIPKHFLRLISKTGDRLSSRLRMMIILRCENKLFLWSMPSPDTQKIFKHE